MNAEKRKELIYDFAVMPEKSEEVKLREKDVLEQTPPKQLNKGEVSLIPHAYRDEMPYLKDPLDRPSVWKILKDAVGKDLTKFCVPVYFNEPISMVQKVAEIMEY